MVDPFPVGRPTRDTLQDTFQEATLCGNGKAREKEERTNWKEEIKMVGNMSCQS